MEFYRTFIGIPVKVDAKFLKTRSELMEMLGGERITWVEPDNFHVTIRFIGATELDQLKVIGEKLEEEVTLPGKTEIGMGSAESFGPRKKPRVVWIGFKETKVFQTLKNEVDRSLQSCGIPASDQAYRAHLTLGRVRILRDRDLFYRTMEIMKNRFSGSVVLEKLVLYKSVLGSGKPAYIPLKAIDFEA